MIVLLGINIPHINLTPFSLELSLSTALGASFLYYNNYGGVFFTPDTRNYIVPGAKVGALGGQGFVPSQERTFGLVRFRGLKEYTNFSLIATFVIFFDKILQRVITSCKRTILGFQLEFQQSFTK